MECADDIKCSAFESIVLETLEHVGCQQQFVGERKGDRKCQEVETGVNDFTRVESGEGILDVINGGKFELVGQEPTWKELEEKMIGLVFNLEGKLRCGLTGKVASDELSE